MKIVSLSIVLSLCMHLAISREMQQARQGPDTRPSKNLQSKTGDIADPALKGPKGETVYSDPHGGKYYFSADKRKIHLDPRTDRNLKGPKGETVYREPDGNKYYINSKGHKTYINKNKTLDKPADKKGTIRKAESKPGRR